MVKMVLSLQKKFLPHGETIMDPKRRHLDSRKSKVTVNEIGKIPQDYNSFSKFFQSLPDILGGTDLKNLVSSIIDSKRVRKGIMIGLGGHVIKTGCSPYLIRLMQEDYVSSIAMNGAAMIHDFEMAFQGKTSEDVEAEIINGAFGLAEETGTLLNSFINDTTKKDLGLGTIMQQSFLAKEFQFNDISLIAQSGKNAIPLTIHVALGTDIIHMHPECDGEAVGRETMKDFRKFCEHLLNLHPGGGYLNLGSAVILPEVFLKALSLARNQNPEFGNIFTANFDFIRHYRPMQSVISRPKLLGAKTFALLGHHEILIPLLTQAILSSER